MSYRGWQGRGGEGRAILPTHILHYLVGREQMGVFIMRERGQEKVKEKLIKQEKEYTKRGVYRFRDADKKKYIQLLTMRE